MYDYNKDLEFFESELEKLENKKDNYDVDFYVSKKQDIINRINRTLERKQNQDDTYACIKNEDHKKEYDAATSLLSYEFNEDLNPGATLMYNCFFSVSNNPNDAMQDERTIDMGVAYFNNVLKAAEEKGINLSDYGIRTIAAENEFIIPHNPKAFLTFSELYWNATSGPGVGGFFRDLSSVFRNTAGDLFGSDGKVQDHEYLESVGRDIYNARNAQKEISTRYGIRDYYMPIISPSNVDIARMKAYVTGDNSTEIKLIDDDFAERLKGANMLSYEIYGNVNDINNENGGAGALELINGNIKNTVNNDIFHNIDKLTFSFSTSGYNYGTTIKIPKGSGYYTVFVKGLFPSTTAEDYINSPYFRANAYIETINAKANKRAVNRNNLGSYYSGSFVGFGNDRFGYKMDGSDKIIGLNKDEAVTIKFYSDLFHEMCLRNGYHDENDPNSPNYNREDIIKFINQDQGSGSLVKMLSFLSGDEEAVVEQRLMNMYDTYYKK